MAMSDAVGKPPYLVNPVNGFLYAYCAGLAELGYAPYFGKLPKLGPDGIRKVKIKTYDVPIEETVEEPEAGDVDTSTELLTPLEQACEAIGELGQDDFSPVTGKPAVAAINQLTDCDVDGKLRDEAWAIVDATDEGEQE
jgi:hypothetical protein